MKQLISRGQLGEHLEQRCEDDAMSTKQNSLNPSHATYFYAPVHSPEIRFLLSTFLY